MLSLLVASRLAPPTALRVEGEWLVPGPIVRLGRSVSSERFSRNGRFLTFIDERPEAGYAAERERIRRGEETTERALVRFDLDKGVRETLYRPAEDETLMRVEPVGPGGDVLVTLAVGVPKNGMPLWRAIYCPVGAAVRRVADDVRARTFQAVASATERRAFLLVVGDGEAARTIFLTPASTVAADLPKAAHQGGFFGVGAAGNPVLGLQGPPPDYALIGNFELDFRTGVARPYLLSPEPPTPDDEGPVVYDTVERSPGDAPRSRLPLRDVVARARENGSRGSGLPVAQGVLASLSVAPGGRAVVYAGTEGYFLRELIPAAPEFAKRLNKG